MRSSRPVNRRALLSYPVALTLAGVSSPISATSRARATKGADPYSAEGLAWIARKVRFRLDEGLVFAWLSGTKYGQIDTELRPLLSFESGAISRVQNRPSGFAVTTWERTFYTALHDGSPLPVWRNPYTGADIPIRRGPSGPTTVEYRHDGSRVTPREIGDSRMDARTVTRLVRVDGEHIWIANDAEVIVTRAAGDGGQFRITEWSTLHAKLGEIADASTRSVEAEVSLQEVTSWAAWMNMGNRPGAVTSRGVGRKVLTYDAMPQQWRRWVEEQHPEVARRPASAIETQAAPFEQ